MKTKRLNQEDLELIEIAKSTIINSYRRNNNISTTVASALLTSDNQVFKGVNVEVRTSFPTSMCAEMGAINQMVTNNITDIKTIVAVWLSLHKKNNWDVIPPCGACRHLIKQFGNPYVIISKNKKALLSEIYPNHER